VVTKAPFVVGFDLDLTLVDSRPGIAAAYRALSERTGVYIDADAAVTRLGPPLDEELARWFPVDQVPAMGDVFRSLYAATAIDVSPALPGAGAAFAAVRALGGGIVVITGKFEPNARLHLAHLGLEVDAVVGWTWAESKITAMIEHGVGIYLGDHPADMAAARAVPAVAIGLLTGMHDASALLAAGADSVLADLTGFPRWLEDGHDLSWVGTRGSVAW
jgi:phosphoglycolate phosphatase